VPLQVLSGGILISIGVRGLLSLRASSTRAEAATDPRVRGSARELYLRFIALTAINPATILYFLALAIGLPGLGSDPMNAVAFTLGAAGASLSWQLLLGGIGAAAGRILPERAVTATRIVGQMLIIGFGTSIAATALRSVA
jgi:threonine/homoserine/homoserine lactone efflux protein